MSKLLAALSVIVSLVGCTNSGGDLAEMSNKYALCSLNDGTQCRESLPVGSAVKKTTLVTTDDTVLISSTVNRAEDCRSYAYHAKSRSPYHVAQATINNVVVLPYGEVIPNAFAVETACARPPYNVSLAVAKAP